MKFNYSFTVFALFVAIQGFAQSNYVPLNNGYYHTVDRYEILNGKLSEEFFTTVKPYTRKAVASFIDSLANDSVAIKRISKSDKFNFAYLANDNWEWSSTAQNDRKAILKAFYKKKSDLFHVSTKDFDLHINPAIYLSAGSERGYNPVSINSRGLELRGMIDKKIGFYTFFTDNQAQMPSYANERRGGPRGVVPGEGFNKDFKTNGVDFITARGYINFNVSKHIALQFGHDKNFIGSGHRSLILSDNSSTYTFLKLNTKIWKINYTNLFTEMTAYPRDFDTLFGKKYVNYHHLSVNIFKNLNVGVFEAVSLRGRNANPAKPGQLDVAYLNPIIFYRSVEQQLGSFDNAVLGVDFKYNFLRHFSLYGQAVLDEFVLRKALAPMFNALNNTNTPTGWWANKQAFQLGLKYIDAFGIKNLDLQGELNDVRPYTYTHFSNYTNFTHYNQPLTHPLGANFKEAVGIIRYQPIPRIAITSTSFIASLGADTSDSNWGGNILLNYATKQQEYNNKTGQGVATKLLYTSLVLSYMPAHNIFIEGYVTYRDYNSSLDTLDRKTLMGGLSIRWYIAPRTYEF